MNFFTSGSGQHGYTGFILYRTELYRRATIERFAGWLTQVVNAFADNVDSTLRDVQLIDAADQRHILTQWSRGAEPPADRPLTIPELLEPSREFGADRIALRCRDEQLDFPALHRRSDNFAQLLADHGVGPGSLVGLSTRRGIDMVVALVGIMKAGRAFSHSIPLTPRAQAVHARRRRAAGRGGHRRSSRHHAGRAPSDADFARRPGRPARDGRRWPAAPATAARSRGPDVSGVHVGIDRQAQGCAGHSPSDDDPTELAAMALPGVGQRHSAGTGVHDVPRRVHGDVGRSGRRATTILADDAEHRDPEALAALIRRHAIAQVTAVPSLVSTLVDEWPDALRSLTRLVCGGEPMTVSLQERLLAKCGGPHGPELLNNFGATETSGALVRGPLTPPVPILGRPLPDSQVYLLDEGLKAVPVGVVGELYYAGGQLVRGYWRRPALTASRFVANPYATEPGARFYRSGDRARWTQDGRLEFVGRTDHQVKVRGFRVELGEVEAALKAADGVAAAAARTWEVDGSTTLAGYVVPHQPPADEIEKSTFAATVRAHMASTLPGYMVPSSITVLDAMPKTESGKLNRPGLPKPAVSTTGRSEPPRTETESAIARVFAEVLSVSEIGRFDDFFALGGDSILSVQVAARARAPVCRSAPDGIREPDGAAAGRGRRDRGRDAGNGGTRDGRYPVRTDEHLRAFGQGSRGGDLVLGQGAQVVTAVHAQTGAAEIEDVLALSPLQQGFFSLARLAGDGVDLYTMQFVADIEGPLDVGRLRRSAEAMLVRHPNLRPHSGTAICRIRYRSSRPRRRCRGANWTLSQPNSMLSRKKSD
ncbi:phosphopantetheine attachment site family protein [Mycobacterium xenopi 3993]|nr:phosphopantetheine attachment site family protein [Mycobacterium xenopi 3993]